LRDKEQVKVNVKGASKIAVVSLRKNADQKMPLPKVTVSKIPKGERVKRVKNSKVS
jgi:hypothetical protein